MSADVRPWFTCLFVIHTVSSACIFTSQSKVCSDSCSSSCETLDQCPEECVQCKAGFYGPDCDRRCEGLSHCLKDKCVLLPSGRALNCSEGCVQGYTGLSCNTRCKYPCVECDRSSGECVGKCRDGFYGTRCFNRCDLKCRSCDKTSTNCTTCWPGYYGADCSLACPKCSRCEKTTGECVFVEVTESVRDSTLGNTIKVSIISTIATQHEDTFEASKDLFRGSYVDWNESFIVIGILIGVTAIVCIIVIVIVCRRYKKQTCHAVAESIGDGMDTCKLLHQSGKDIEPQFGKDIEPGPLIILNENGCIQEKYPRFSLSCNSNHISHINPPTEDKKTGYQTSDVIFQNETKGQNFLKEQPRYPLILLT